MARIANHTSEQTKERIISSFIKLLEKNDVDRISVSELCRTAKINRGTFYYYYKDIFDLVSQLENRLINELKIIFPNLIDGIFNKELSLLTEMFNKIEENRDFFLSVLERRPSGKIQSEMKEYVYDYTTKLFNSNLSNLPIKQKGILEYMASGQAGIVWWWIKKGQLIPADEFAKIVLEINESGPFNALLKEKA
ncbi:MAG: TetR/AcrR family transcriptional regulator [Clostridiales bacterium]|nr:TetR/AcrR family transcriptional regulator [Clostridiales bacterium]